MTATAELALPRFPVPWRLPRTTGSAVRVTVTHVEVMPDMRQAKVHVSVMGSDTKQKLCLRGLQSAAGYLQSKIANRIETRYTPRLEFVLDMGVKKSIEKAGDQAAQAAQKAGHAVSEGAEKAADWTKEQAHHMANKSKEAAQKAGDALKQAGQDVKDKGGA